MSPATIALIISLVEEAIKLRPMLQEELSALFSAPDPKPEDWVHLRERVLTTPFETLAPDAPTG